MAVVWASFFLLGKDQGGVPLLTEKREFFEAHEIRCSWEQRLWATFWMAIAGGLAEGSGLHREDMDRQREQKQEL